MVMAKGKLGDLLEKDEVYKAITLNETKQSRLDWLEV
jgi:hypothetical protein